MIKEEKKTTEKKTIREISKKAFDELVTMDDLRGVAYLAAQETSQLNNVDPAMCDIIARHAVEEYLNSK